MFKHILIPTDGSRLAAKAKVTGVMYVPGATPQDYEKAAKARARSGLLLGSETARVLAHSKIPVLVTR
ncbi:MAG TPA: hypothetical protein VGJ74_16695 [Burkholderiales bacterium]|jgi:nucleotide-binding universal stress UspA family protein